MSPTPAARPLPEQLEREGLNRPILRLALPAVGENLLVTLVFVADTFVVGHLGDPEALAAVGVSGPLFFVLNTLFLALSIAATAVVARRWGRGDREGAGRAAGVALGLALLAAVGAVGVGWILAPPALRWMGLGARTVRLGTLYLRILLVGSLFSFPMTVTTAVLRASGDTRTPLRVTAVMNLWNVVAALLLVFGWGPVPRLEVAGAALATASARLLGSLLAFRAVLRPSGGGLRVPARALVRWEPGMARTLARLAAPVLLEGGVQRLGSILFLRLVTGLGETAVAAHQVAIALESVSFMPGFAFSVAASALAGQCLGARRPDLARRAVGRAWAFGVGTMGAVALLFAVAGPGLAALFGATPQVRVLAGTAIRIGALEQIPLATVMVLLGALRGAGDTRSSFWVTLAGVLLFRVPAVWLLAYPLGLGLAGVWLGTALDWTGRAVVAWILVRRGGWLRVRV